MTELALHILDIVQNSIVAGAKLIRITVVEDQDKDFLSIGIADDGKGMEQCETIKVTDPYYTSRTTRKVGLGIPLFKQAAEQCNGSFQIQSEKGVGTKVLATFQLHHIDRQPLGDIPGVMSILVSSNPGLDFVYEHSTPSGKYKFDTREARQILEGVPINDPQVTRFIKEMILENLNDIQIID